MKLFNQLKSAFDKLYEQLKVTYKIKCGYCGKIEKITGGTCEKATHELYKQGWRVTNEEKIACKDCFN